MNVQHKNHKNSNISPELYMRRVVGFIFFMMVSDQLCYAN